MGLQENIQVSPLQQSADGLTCDSVPQSLNDSSQVTSNSSQAISHSPQTISHSPQLTTVSHSKPPTTKSNDPKAATKENTDKATIELSKEHTNKPTIKPDPQQSRSVKRLSQPETHQQNVLDAHSTFITGNGSEYL